MNLVGQSLQICIVLIRYRQSLLRANQKPGDRMIQIKSFSKDSELFLNPVPSCLQLRIPAGPRNSRGIPASLPCASSPVLTKRSLNCSLLGLRLVLRVHSWSLGNNIQWLRQSTRCLQERPDVGVGAGPGIPKVVRAAGCSPRGLVEESLCPRAAERDLRPPSRPGAPGLALPRGPRCDPEALRKRFRSGRRQDGGGHAGEAGGRGANAAGGGARARAAGAGLPGRRLRR